MATWSELVAYARGQGLAFDESTPEQIGLVFEYDDGRRQKITVARARTRFGDLLELRGLLGDESSAPARELLERNADLELGGICLLGTSYVLRYTASLAHLDGASFVSYLQDFAGIADRLEKRLTNADQF